jgi:hypothetical protein
VDDAGRALLAVFLEISVKLGTPDIKSMPVKRPFVQSFHNSEKRLSTVISVSYDKFIDTKEIDLLYGAHALDRFPISKRNFTPKGNRCLK